MNQDLPNVVTSVLGSVATSTVVAFDELTVTVVPVILGAGFPLFTGAARRALRLESTALFEGGILQLRYTPAADG